jgi:hypothetical protein
MKPATLMTRTEQSLKLAAERAVRSCAPVLVRTTRSLIDREQAQELDEARGALMGLASALESYPPKE